MIEAHRDLETLCLTKEQLEIKHKFVDERFAYYTYHGFWFHPIMNDLNSFIDSSQETLYGTIGMKLYKGEARIITRESDFSLFKPEIRSLFRDAEMFDQSWSTNAVKIHTLPFRIMYMRKKKK